MKHRHAGFTLIELMVVIVIVAIASAVATLALRDPAATELDHEAARLAALLESARAEARASGLPVRWIPQASQQGAEGFQFVGLPATTETASHWLQSGVTAEVIGSGPTVVLGPEPMIGAQRIVLHLNDQQIAVVTDGLGPFAIDDGTAVSP